MKKIVVVSNGYGEDYIASIIINALQQLDSTLEITPIPLVGQGKIFEHQKFTLVIKNPHFPSGGFIRSVKDLVLDIKAGLITHLFRQKRSVKALSEEADLSICVGDIFCLWMGRHHDKCIFLPTAKSDTFMTHSFIEKLLMNAHCTSIFTRDQLTADSLKNANLPAEFLGNPMMDHLLTSSTDIPLDDRRPIIGILPGSREEAYANLESIRPIISEAEKQRSDIQWVVSIAPQIDETKIRNLLQSHSVHLSTDFNQVITRSWAMIGLAGTANEQAVAVGNTVIAFPGKGPQSSPLRFSEQEKLLGKNLLFINSQDPAFLSQQLLAHLDTLTMRPNKTEPNAQSAAKKIAERILLELSKP